jgi:hypothetical protein
VAHTFEELVEKKRAADAAHTKVLELRETFGPPAHEPWADAQTETYETAWRAWRDLARDVQDASHEYARDEGRPRPDVEEEVARAAGSPPSAAG